MGTAAEEDQRSLLVVATEVEDSQQREDVVAGRDLGGALDGEPREGATHEGCLTHDVHLDAVEALQ
jgi:hypothetical protein